MAVDPHIERTEDTFGRIARVTFCVSDKSGILNGKKSFVEHSNNFCHVEEIKLTKSNGAFRSNHHSIVLHQNSISTTLHHFIQILNHKTSYLPSFLISTSN